MAENESYMRVPIFGGGKSYESWLCELQAWQVITNVAKKKQAVAIALSFEESEVRQRVFHEIKLEELHADDGLDKLLEHLDKWYKKDKLSGAYDAWNNFDKYTKEGNESIETYIFEYQKRCKSLEKHSIDIPKCVLAFKLLDCAGLEHREKQLVLTAVDYSEPDKLLDQMINALKKFFGNSGVQASTSKQSNSCAIKIKSEPGYVTEEVNVVNRYQRGQRRQENSGSRGNNWAYDGGQERNYSRGSNRANYRRQKNQEDIEGYSQENYGRQDSQCESRGYQCYVDIEIKT